MNNLSNRLKEIASFIPDNIKIVSREVKDISTDESKIENLLAILKEKEVTPVAVEEIIKDLQPEYLS